MSVDSRSMITEMITLPIGVSNHGRVEKGQVDDARMLALNRSDHQDVDAP